MALEDEPRRGILVQVLISEVIPRCSNKEAGRVKQRGKDNEGCEKLAIHFFSHYNPSP